MKTNSTIKFFDKPLVYIISSFLLSVGFLVLGSRLGKVIIGLLPDSESDLMNTVPLYLAFIGIWIVTIVYCFLTPKNRPVLKAMTLKAKGNGIKTSLIWGIAAGMGINLVSAFAAMINGDIHISFYGFELVPFLFMLVAVGIQSGAEELVCRMFLLQRLRRVFPNHLWIPIIGNALLFGFLHINNPGTTVLSIINIIVVGILYGEMVVYLDSFWSAVIAHTTWNFTQAIILGLPNSGIVLPFSVFKLDAANARDSIFYSVGFGIEGTVFTDLILLAAVIGMYLYFSKKKTPSIDVWHGELQ